MKSKLILLFFVIFLVTLSCTNNVFSANWRVETIDSDPEVRYNTHVKITLDNQKNPHIVYGEKTINYAYLDENGWHTEQLYSFSVFGQAWPSIAIDVNGNAHIVYRNHEIEKLVYVTNTNGEWQYHTFEFDGSSPEIAVDSHNIPHIVASVYHESSDPSLGDGGFKPHHITNSSGVWEKEPIGERGTGYKIVIDLSDKIHVVFITYNTYDKASLSYSTNITGSWNFGIFIDEGYYNALKLWQLYIDPNGTLQLVYQKTHNTRYYPGSCGGDCYYNDFKQATKNSEDWLSWTVETIETTNHWATSDDTIPAGETQYFGISNKDISSRYDYLFTDGNGYTHNAAVVTGDLITQTIIEDGITIKWFDAVSNLSGNPHAFYYDATNNLFKYATNSSIHDFDKDSDVDGKDLAVFINTNSATIDNETLSDFASNFGQSM